MNLRSSGDSGNDLEEYDSKISAEDLHQLIGKLVVGPVPLTGQDTGDATLFRLATTHPEDVLSREREFRTKIALPVMCAIPGAVSDSDVDEFIRTRSRPSG